jgi:hypothetical protein
MMLILIIQQCVINEIDNFENSLKIILGNSIEKILRRKVEVAEN